MSKTRQTATSPFASAAPTPSPATFGGASYSSARSQQMGMMAAKKAAMGSSPATLPPPPPIPQQQQHERWEPSSRAGGGHFSGSLAPKQSSSSLGVYDPSLRAEPVVVAARSGVPPEYYQRAQPVPQLPHQHQQQTSTNDMYHEQLELDEPILAETMSLAFKQMVGEQDCCFIAKGICHLCGTNERHLIPVVNFCPEFHVNHSLCREHLRSMHRVRMEDIFAGKNRPTVSKRSLKCSVCSRSCPCSTCQLEKQHEISKYKRWLAGEREYELDSEDRSMGNSNSSNGGGDQSSRMGHNPLPLSKKPRSSNSSGGGGGGREYLPNAGQSLRELHSAQRLLPPVVDDSRAFQMSLPHVDLSNQDEEHRMIASLQAGSKPPSHAYRGAKRAAKDVKSSHQPALNVSGAGAAFGPNAVGQSPLNRLYPGEPIESPSAAHVLNCAESEKSLVRLLTTLNQEVASSAAPAPALAEPKDSGSQLSAANGRRQPSPLLDGHPSRSVDARNGAEEEKVSGHGGTAGSSSYTDAGDGGSSASSRNPKRKRDANDSATAHLDSETSSETSASNSRSGQQNHGKNGGGSTRADASGRKALPNSTRGTGPHRENTPKPSPATKLTTKPKQKDGRRSSITKASPTPASSSGRKRNGGEPSSAHQASAEKKSPHPRKPTAGSKGTTPRELKDSGGKRAGARKAVHENEEDEDAEDSEIDTNLDYCEVCLAAGDLVCCDVCPRSFHLACLKMKESDLPEGDWQCAECRKPSFFVRYRATVDMKQSIYGKCVETIRCLKTHPYSKQFLSPVTNIEHYRSIVKQPMDLSTIEAKLKADKYTNSSSNNGNQQQTEKQIDIEAFANDVRLVWTNCKLFNDDGSGITRAADELAAGFEDIYQDMQQYVKKMAARSAARAVSKPSGNARGENHLQQVAKSTGGPSSAPRVSEGKKPVGATDSNGGNSGSAAKKDEGKQSEGPASASSSTESEPRQPSASRAPPSSNAPVSTSTFTAQKPAAEPKMTTSSSANSDSKAPASEAKSRNSSDKPTDGESKGDGKP